MTVGLGRNNVSPPRTTPVDQASNEIGQGATLAHVVAPERGKHAPQF